MQVRHVAWRDPLERHPLLGERRGRRRARRRSWMRPFQQLAQAALVRIRGCVWLAYMACTYVWRSSHGRPPSLSQGQLDICACAQRNLACHDGSLTGLFHYCMLLAATFSRGVEGDAASGDEGLLWSYLHIAAALWLTPAELRDELAAARCARRVCRAVRLTRGTARARERNRVQTANVLVVCMSMSTRTEPLSAHLTWC